MLATVDEKKQIIMNITESSKSMLITGHNNTGIVDALKYAAKSKKYNCVIVDAQTVVLPVFKEYIHKILSKHPKTMLVIHNIQNTTMYNQSVLMTMLQNRRIPGKDVNLPASSIMIVTRLASKDDTNYQTEMNIIPWV